MHVETGGPVNGDRTHPMDTTRRTQRITPPLRSARTVGRPTSANAIMRIPARSVPVLGEINNPPS
eukprot:13603576-Alexandrium_andersonii.AAC.1